VTFPPDPQGSQYPDPGNYPSSGYGAAPPYRPYQAYPAQPKRLRGRRAIQVGGALMILGLAVAILGGVLAGTKSYSKVNGFQRVAVSDGTGTVTFSHAGGYVAYYESDSVTDSTSQQVPEVRGTLTYPATNATVTLDTPYGNRSDGKIKFLHYDHDGHKGVALWQFHIDQPGAWKVQLQALGPAGPDAVLAFGPSIAQGVVIGAILAILGVLLLIAGLITLIIGLVKRRRHKREIRTGGYGGYGAPVAASAAGWPPGGAAGWPSGGGASGPGAPGSPGAPSTPGWPHAPSTPGWPGAPSTPGAPPPAGGTYWPQPGGAGAGDSNWPQPHGEGADPGRPGE
jgi:hypothetical protein